MDELVRGVLERHIAIATEAGVTQAVYPESGLTKDGCSREPRFGVLDYVLRGFRSDGERDLVFVPIGLNYDRVLDDRTRLLGVDLTQASRRGRMHTLGTTLRFLGPQLGLVLPGHWHPFGYACVNFGTPVSVRAWSARRGLRFESLAQASRQAQVDGLGEPLMERVGSVVPALPVPMVASVLLAAAPQRLSELEIKACVGEPAQRLESRGAHRYVARGDRDHALSTGLRKLMQRRVVDEAERLKLPRPGEEPLLRYYANSIAHLLEAVAPPH
jgi:glycerol-3-phosphate O-acyltransferase